MRSQLTSEYIRTRYHHCEEESSCIIVYSTVMYIMERGKIEVESAQKSCMQNYSKLAEQII